MNILKTNEDFQKYMLWGKADPGKGSNPILKR